MSRAVRLATVVAGLVALVTLSWHLNVLDVRASVPFASVATAFDDPPGFPGYGWTRNGGTDLDAPGPLRQAGPIWSVWTSRRLPGFQDSGTGAAAGN